MSEFRSQQVRRSQYGVRHTAGKPDRRSAGVEAAALKVAYFVHDLSDPAVTKRVRMLRIGGAQVTVVGFRRTDTAPETIEGCPVLDLGKTEPNLMARRALSVLLSALNPGALINAVADCDVIVARNLEMLTLARWARGLRTKGPPIVYECLDIHRLMLSQGPAGKLLRGLERMLMAASPLVITSSPAFVDHYFRGLQGRKSAVGLVENKLLPPGDAHRPVPGAALTPPPWRIGWFGNVRCHRSLDMLASLARAMPGQVEIVIAGRPVYSEMPDFHEVVGATPGMRFLGEYGPDDLEGLYGQVHFAWALDYFEAGGNSDWLLPNRIYEGAYFNCVPIALASVETGRWIARKHIGVEVGEDPVADLLRLLPVLTMAEYERHAHGVHKLPTADVAFNEDACYALVQSLAKL